MLAGTGTRTEIAASIVQAVSFEGLGPSTATIDMIARLHRGWYKDRGERTVIIKKLVTDIWV